MRPPTFSPAEHLAKQGWKGKGTALKDGHAKRPIAVVQKKTLSGIGKDRDEAIPFWDHIFASTAASLASSNNSPSASGTSTPTQPKPVVSIAARSGKEIAKRKLYSSFLRSSVPTTPMPFEDEEVVEAAVEVAEVEVAEAADTKSKRKDKGKERSKSKSKSRKDADEVGESKEERRERREARRAKKEAKVAARAAKAEKKALKAPKGEKGDKVERRAAREARRAARAHGKA